MPVPFVFLYRGKGRSVNPVQGDGHLMAPPVRIARMPGMGLKRTRGAHVLGLVARRGEIKQQFQESLLENLPAGSEH